MGTVIAIDQGTTSTKVLTLAADGTARLLAALPHRQHYPRPGWVEHDAGELERQVREALRRGWEASDGSPAGLGLDNQGETVVAWDRREGRPLHHAIVWQDDRTREVIERLKRDGAEALSIERCGLPLDPYFSASKLRWLLDHAPGARGLLERGRLGLGTSDAFLVERLTGVYATDPATASRTGLMNLDTRSWDPELCALFGVPAEALPEIRPTTAGRGVAALEGRGGVALCAAIVDQQAALFGHGCARRGAAKITFGTGAFMLAHTGEAPVRAPEQGVLPTLAWELAGEGPRYAVEGGVYLAGAAIEWLRRLGLLADYAELGDFAGPSAASRGLFFVPALSGLGCPFWDRSATGLWIGLRPETGREDLCRAVLEGVALRAAQVLDRFTLVAGPDSRLRIDGGLSASGYFRRFLAALTGRVVELPSLAEMTAYGTARLALLGAGLAGRLEDLPAEPPLSARHRPEPGAELGEVRARFESALERARGWWP